MAWVVLYNGLFVMCGHEGFMGWVSDFRWPGDTSPKIGVPEALGGVIHMWAWFGL